MLKISYSYCRILTDSYPKRSVQAAQETKNGVDLLEEFDKGMKVIESWKVGDEAD